MLTSGKIVANKSTSLRTYKVGWLVFLWAKVHAASPWV